MNHKQESDKGDPLLLSSEDRDNGFSIVADDHHNITLLRWSKPVAWFSAAVTEDVLRAFLKLVKGHEENAKGTM
jgi:hypothetical protein